MIVGPSSRNYRLHKRLLCHHSAFFDAAFNGEFQEGVSGQLSLLEEDADAFDLFVHWLYRGSLPHYDDLCTSLDWFSLYTMGDKWFMPRLQDRVCVEMRKYWCCHQFPGRLFLQNLYKTTSPGCKLRQYFVKKVIFYAMRGTDQATINDALEENAELAIDIAKEMLEKVRIIPGFDPEFPHHPGVRS